MTGVFIKRVILDTDMHMGRTPCAAIQVTPLQAKERQRLPGNHQKLEREKHGTNYPSKPSEGTTHANTLILDFQPPELRQEMTVLKPLRGTLS